MARPTKDVDADTIQKLASIGCSNKDIADFVGISHDTLTRRFRAQLEAGRANGRIKLRNKQMEQALAGNTTMLIWLGKQILGQTDKVQTETTITDVTLTFGNAEGQATNDDDDAFDTPTPAPDAAPDAA